MRGRANALPEGTVTFLFTDIEGSTPLLTRLGRDRYGELLEAHRVVLREAIAGAGGSEVNTEGDSLFAVFPTAAGAATAAVAAQRGLERQTWPDDATIRVRAGLHTGEATVVDGDYLGIAVHRARRVCDAAHGGQVLASSATAEVLRAEPPPAIELRDLAEVRLAGFDSPERVFQLVADRLREDFPEPRAPRPWREERPALLERAEELAAVDRALAAANAGGGRLVVIEGPAGIGKSSVLAEARSRAADGGMMVLRARGSELEAPFAYGVVRQLFEPPLAPLDDDQRSRLFGGAAAHAAPIFDPAQALDVAAAGEDVAFARAHGLYWLALNLAEMQPLLVAVDDLHWSDAASLRWLSFLARRVEGLPVGVLAAVRPIEDEDPVLAELLADPATTLVRPTALTAAAVEELVRATLSLDAEEPFAVACHRATGGNPLLVRELVRTLATEDVTPDAASVEAVERLAPDAVARSVKLRLSRLPADAAALARSVAILGDGVEGAHAAALAGIERRSLGPAAAVLARVDLLRQDPPLRFVHPVVRNAVYESENPYARAREHARAARVLAAAGASVEHVVGQVLLAPPESVEDAVALLREAARRAAIEGAPHSAARYLGRALEEPLSDQERAELLLALTQVEFTLGASSVVAHLREAIPLLGDPERRVVAQWQLGRALYWAGQDDEGVALLDRALAEREGAEDDLQRRIEADLIANATRVASQYADARRRLDAIAVTPAEGPGARMLLGLQAYHESARGGSRQVAVERAEAALAAMEDEERTWNYTGGIYALWWSDRVEEALRFIEPAISAVRRDGAVFSFSALSMTRAILNYVRGALTEAEADARTGLEALPHGRAWFVPHSHGWLAQILVERGMLDEAAAVLHTVEGRADVGANPFARTPLLRARALLDGARGDHQAALHHVLELGSALAAFGHDNPVASYPAWRSLAALEHHALGDDGAALGLATEEVELARAWGAPRTLGRALRVLGLVEGGQAGIERLREAVAVLEDSPARLEHAYALADLGGALRRANHRAEAREPLREAVELAQRLGGTLLAERAHEELVAAGARPRRAVLTGVDALTPSERRIAAMAAEGLSNRDIAQALFVTLRTVEMHLSNAFRKLDISSRTQLASALAASSAEAAGAGAR